MPEERDDQRQPDRRFRGGHRHHEERDDLAVHVAPVAAECDERQVHRVQHDLDREQNRDQIPAKEHSGGADGKENRRNDQVMMQRNHDGSSLRARTTAPTMATRIRIDVASNANAWRSNSTLPSSRTELTVAASAWPPTGASYSAISKSAHASCTTSSAARIAPNRATPRCRSGCSWSHSAASSCGALSSMTTNRNSTMMAPA